MLDRRPHCLVAALSSLAPVVESVSAEAQGTRGPYAVAARLSGAGGRRPIRDADARPRKWLRVIPLLLLAASCAGRGRAESLVSSSYVPFTMAAISQDSAFTGTFTGRMRAAGDDVELLLDAGRLTYTGAGRYAGPREVGSVAFAFAQGDRADYWRVASRSDRTRLRRVVTAGAELLLDSLRVRIDRRGLPLSEYWLVVEIENVVIDVPATSQARGLAYLHSDRAFFRAMP